MNDTINPIHCYSTDEVAEILGVHPDTVRGLIKDRRIVYFKVGRHFKIRGQALLDYFKRFERQAICAAPVNRLRGRKAA